ncbi:MAG: polysaccharide biosynthesis tyrosine autokinase [Bryobacteraceae bacterium]
MSDIVRRTGSYLPDINTRQQREPSAPYPTNTLTTLNILRMLKKQKLLIAGVTLLVIGTALISVRMATPLYQSVALIQVNPDSIQVLPYRDIADSGVGVYYEVYMSTQDQILKGADLWERVAARLKLEPSNSALAAEIPLLGKRFQVKRVPNSQLFQISYRAASPDAAARVVNLYAEEYLKQHLEARQATRQKAKESLQRELEGLEKRVQVSEKGLATYARREGIIDMGPGQGDLAQKRLVSLDQQVADDESSVMLAQSRLKALEEATLETFPDRLTTPVVSNLTSRLLQAEQELTSMRASFGENWPGVISKRGEIDLIREQLTREKKLVLARATEDAQIGMRTAKNKLATSLGLLTHQKELVNRFNDVSIEYNILRREVETNQQIYQSLLERLSQTSLQKGFEFGNIQIVEPGRPSSEIESPRVMRDLIWAALIGLTLGIGAAFLRDFWDNSISTLEEAEELTCLPGLGTVPSSRFFPSNGSNGHSVPLQITSVPVDVLGPRSTADMPRALPPPEVAEAMREVCASILLSQSDHPLRVIAITSVAPAEGKTTVVSEMGRVFAESGARTLLVGADLRRPALARAFAIDEGEGLSLFLSGQIPTPRICETEQQNLFVAPAGPKPPNPVALLGSDRMTAFIQQMSSSFRFVLLDTPPILAVADARVVGAKVDGLILVARAGKTPKSLILRAQTVVQHSGLNLLGLILNRVDPADMQSVYYRHYYSNN